jgi:uncharacterized protein (DUF1800 family)
MTPKWYSPVPTLSAHQRKLGVCAVWLVLSLQVGPAPLLAAEGGLPRLSIRGTEVHLVLPDGTARHDLLTQLERSTDGHQWLPLARDYGANWHGLMPQPARLSVGQGGGTELQDARQAGAVFYRVTANVAAAVDNRARAARFLQQATFGPTLADIDAFPGVADASPVDAPPYPALRAWLAGQMAQPATSLRAYWRQRSNPQFVDNTAQSPTEVAFNPELGFILPYRVGRDVFMPSQEAAIAAGRQPNDVEFPLNEVKRLVWYQVALTAPDQLRQRVAWALSQLFVVSETGLGNAAAVEGFLHYYDIFVRHAFDNFRDVLGEVTWSPLMAEYLTYVDNRPADPQLGTFPDENYAREVMQLFTIGLWELNMDGTLRLDAAGQAIATYDNDTIEQLAKVFTGLRLRAARPNIELRARNLIDPLRVDVRTKDFSAKTLWDGRVIGPFPRSVAGATAEINTVLDRLVQHSNTPPFVARFMIQRLVTSNPSPAYIRSVAEAFAAGQHAGFGSGQRGDLAATVAAVLLHPEARAPALMEDPRHGALREPLVRFIHFCRALNIQSRQTHGLIPFNELELQFGQAPFDAPSVFNYYTPDFQPAGELMDYGLYAPEFQIHNDVTAIHFPNALRLLVRDGLRRPVGFRGYAQAVLELGREQTLAANAAELVEHLNLLLTAGRLSDANRALVTQVLNRMPGRTTAHMRDRVRIALSLFVLLPEFNVLQ